MIGRTLSHYKITEKHPAELHFHQMLKEIKSLLEKCENQFLDGEELEFLKKELTTIKFYLPKSKSTPIRLWIFILNTGCEI
jgi:hypothetical protein